MARALHAPVTKENDMSCSKVLGLVVVMTGLAACREPAGTTSTTSAATTANPTAFVTATAPHPVPVGETPSAPIEPAQNATRPAETAAAPAAPASPATTRAEGERSARESERSAPLPAATVPRRVERNRAPQPAPTTDDPASMYGYDRATGGPMRPGAASNPNTTSGADPRR